MGLDRIRGKVINYYRDRDEMYDNDQYIKVGDLCIVAGKTSQGDGEHQIFYKHRQTGFPANNYTSDSLRADAAIKNRQNFFTDVNIFSDQTIYTADVEFQGGLIDFQTGSVLELNNFVRYNGGSTLIEDGYNFSTIPGINFVHDGQSVSVFSTLSASATGEVLWDGVPISTGIIDDILDNNNFWTGQNIFGGAPFIIQDSTITIVDPGGTGAQAYTDIPWIFDGPVTINGDAPLTEGSLYLESVVGGVGIDINDTDPKNPIINRAGTTAGTTSFSWFTGNSEVLGAGTFYKTDVVQGGTTTTQGVVVNDNQTVFFAQDLITDEAETDVILAAGSYEAELSVNALQVNGEQSYTIEVYRTDNAGNPIASGVTGAPVGDLGVTVLATLTTGTLDLNANDPTVVRLRGTLPEQVTILETQRVRHHVGASKIGTAGGTNQMEVSYGDGTISGLEIPILPYASTVINDSSIAGSSVKDALEWLGANSGGGGGSFNFFCNANDTVNTTEMYLYLMDIQSNNSQNFALTNPTGRNSGQICSFPRGMGRVINEITITAAKAAVSQGTVGAAPSILLEFFTNEANGRTTFGVVSVPVDAGSISEVLTFNNGAGTGTDLLMTATGLSLAIPDDAPWGCSIIHDATTNEDINLMGQVIVGIKGVNT